MSTRETEARTRHAVEQILTFTLEQESYGVDLLQVKEIRGWAPITAMPESPPFVLGILNLRGAIVPIIDLRARFGFAPMEHTPLTVVIVVSVRTEAGTREFGLVVDGVSDVLDVMHGAMKQAPALGEGRQLAYLRGLVEQSSGLVKLLDVEQLLGTCIAAA